MAIISLVQVGPDTLEECGIGCIANQRHEGYAPKVKWLQKRFDEGLRYLLFRDERGKALAFLEYVPGEFAWRPVRADGWLFIHCLWVYRAGQKIGGLGSRLIQRVVKEAESQGALGVATLVSDGPWMAGGRIYQRNGFEVVEQQDRFELWARSTGAKASASRRKGTGALSSSLKIGVAEIPSKWKRGLRLIYAPQCPMLPKSVNDLREMAAEHGLKLQVSELKSADAAQRAPSLYGVYALLWNGRLLADHYVSKGRFKNLLRKEILNDE